MKKEQLSVRACVPLICWTRPNNCFHFLLHIWLCNDFPVNFSSPLIKIKVPGKILLKCFLFLCVWRFKNKQNLKTKKTKSILKRLQNKLNFSYNLKCGATKERELQTSRENWLLKCRGYFEALFQEILFCDSYVVKDNCYH